MSTKEHPLTSLKKEFYRWCGYLSVDEIIENRELIQVIEKIQRMFLSVGA